MFRRFGVAVAAIAALLVPAGVAEASAVVEITISNFHYCEGEICTFADQAYLRPAATGPVLEDVLVNPLGVIEARQGDTVTWTYRDTTWCDVVRGCPGHDVVFEDGTVVSPLLRARDAEPQTFSWTVPDTVAANTLILYYCSLPGFGTASTRTPTGHSDVMTGALRIVE